jgi:hypothetical protein
MWPVRPNATNTTNPQSFNVYWDPSSTGTFTRLLGSVSNCTNLTPEAFGNRSYYQKIVLNVCPSQIAGWNNDIANYINMKAVIGGVEQAFESVVVVAPYTTNSLMRLHYPEIKVAAAVGWNDSEQRFIPVAVDTNGKVNTI